MKKFLLIVILALIAFVSTGCKKESVIPSYVAAENIYSLNGDKYLIYFEKETCSQCAQTLPYVIEYLTETSGKKGALDIYRISLEYTDENGDTITLPISRAFDKADTGQGPNGNFYVNGVSDWVALYIAATPSLVEISTVNGTKQSNLVAVGTTEIENYLNTLRNEK